jgi:O-antigen/teichoic acid export membrane protein
VNRWLLNILSSYLRFVVSIGAVVFVTPLIIERIGLESYGIWALVLATVGLLGLMDFGLATSAVKFIAEKTGQSDSAGRNRVLSVLMTLYSAIAAALMIVASIVAMVGDGPGIFGNNDQSAILTIAVAGCVAASLFLSLFRATLAGAGMMYLANSAEIATTLLYLVLVVTLVDHGVQGLSAALLLSTVGGAAIMAIIAATRVPGLRIRLTTCRWSEIEGLVSFSAWAFLANAAVLAILRMDPIIIESFMPLTAVAIYAVGSRIAEYALLLNKQFSNALMPLVSQAHGRGDAAAVEWVLKGGSRYLLIVAMPMLALLAFHAESLLVLWLGSDLREATGPLRLLTLAVFLSVLQLNAANVLGMTGRHRFVGKSMIAAATLNLSLTLILVPSLGLVGAALATLVASATIETGVIVPAACRRAGIRIPTFLRHVLEPALIYTIPVVGVAAVLSSKYPPESLAGLVVNGLVSTVLALPVLALLGLSGDERNFVLRAIVRLRGRVPAVSGGAS